MIKAYENLIKETEKLDKLYSMNIDIELTEEEKN